MKGPICEVCGKEIERGTYSTGKPWYMQAWLNRKAHKACKSQLFQKIMIGNTNSVKKPGQERGYKRRSSGETVKGWQIL